MKKLALSLFCLLSSHILFAQWAKSSSDTNNIYNSNSGYVGIGTTTPLSLLDLGNGGGIKQLIYGSGGTPAYLMGFGIDLGQAPNTFTAFIGPPGGNGSSGNPSFSIASATSAWPYTSYTTRLTVLATGNVGIGTTNPQAPLHVLGTGVTLNNYQEYSGTMSIQANTGGRSDSTGAALEFVIPANTDGTNPWGQGRIITVAGNSSSGYAVGKMILGTRRLANKFGIGNEWYYGNDITIDGSGNVGIGTLNPQSLLSVEGNITAQQVTVTQNNWSDFVFDSSYQRMPLKGVSDFIAYHRHLPDIPSAGEIARSGLDLGAMQKLQMQKIEELTLYVIDADKHAKQQDSTIALQQRELQEEHNCNNEQKQLLVEFQQRLELMEQKIDNLQRVSK